MDTDVSIDELLQALADRQRRIVLRELAGAASNEIAVDALEETVVHCLERPALEVHSRAEVAVQLRHVHLPTLDDVGLCEYDANRERVEYDSDEFVESLLEFIDERRQSGQRR